MKLKVTGSCERKMAKLLLKLVTQEKEGDDAKNSSQKLLAILQQLKNKSFRILTSLQIDWTLFYAKLSLGEYSALWKVFVLIFCMFHGQSAV